MESLHVENFLVFQNVDIPIDKFTVIIGQQASGKSLVAKLVYFFRKFVRDIYVESINKGQVKRQVEREGLSLFEQYFPRYAWGNAEFEIVYTVSDVEIVVKRERNNRGELRVRLDYSKKLAELHRRFKFEYRKHIEKERETGIEKKKGDGVRIGHDVWREFRHTHLEDFLNQYVFPAVFIPASRSFFANLQKNVFSFLASNIDIDPFIKEFGFSYENSKRLYEIRHFILREDRFQNDEGGSDIDNLRDDIDRLMQAILKGKYVFDDEQDWIENSGRRINLSNASSGQQEALPMLVMLSTLPFLPNQKSTFFIEEPEAHLFPKAQRSIVDLFSLLYMRGQGVVITTHSPYILTAINNLILAGDIVRNDRSLFDRVKQEIGIGFPIDYDDVGAYFMENGSLQNIKDSETRLIGASLIDGVSEEFAQIFDRLLDLDLGGQEK